MSEPHAEKTLVGWKEIARFFTRTESTVKRWEASRGLPIHRVPGSTGATVFAYEGELRAWLKGHPAEQNGQNAPTGIPENGAAQVSGQRRFLAPLAAMLGIALIVAGAGYFSSGLWRGKDRSAEMATSPDARATQLYKAALFEWQTRTPAGLGYAVKDFQGAIARDPHYAMAYAGLADCYNLLREFTPMRPEFAYPRAKAAAERAIALNPSIAEAHAALAFDDFYWSRDEANARKQFSIALTLKPDSANIHHWYATFLMTVRDFPHALSEIDDAAHLDPESTAILADKGLILAHSGKITEGVALLQRLEQTQPQFLSPHRYLADIYLAASNDKPYLQEIELVARLRGDARDQQIAAAAAKGLTAGGHKGMLQSILEAQKRLYEIHRQSAYQLALAYANVGDWKNAVGYLKVSLARHEPENIAIAVSPALRLLRPSPGFRALLAAAGLSNAS